MSKCPIICSIICRMSVPVSDPRVKRGATVTLEAAHIVKNILPS